MSAIGTKLTSHLVENELNPIEIIVMDNPGKGGANQLYGVTGFQEGSLKWISQAYAEACKAGALQDGLPIFAFGFQNGSPAEVGTNGLTMESLLAILVHRLEGFQSGPFANLNNAAALNHLRAAQEALKARTAARVTKLVESTVSAGAESASPAPYSTLSEYLFGEYARGVIDHKVRIESGHAGGAAKFYIRPANHDGQTINFYATGTHVCLEAQSFHTLLDDFEHMLAYTGLAAESGEIQAKLLHAFAEGRGEPIPEGELSRRSTESTVIEAVSSTLHTTSCEIKNLKPTEKDGNLVLIRMEKCEHLLVSSSVLRVMADDADWWACRGKSLLVDVTPRDQALVNEGGSRRYDVEALADDLFRARAVEMRAGIAEKAKALGLNDEQIESLVVNIVGEEPKEIAAPSLKFGDSVWLNSGGPEMKVAHVQALPDGSISVACTWPGAERLESANFDSRQLSINPIALDTVQLPPVVIPAPVQSIEINQVIKRDGDAQ